MRSAVVFVAFASLLPASAGAGVFGIPHFVEQGSFAFGIEPEIVLNGDAGLGVNGRFIYGLTELNNVQIIAGTGGGGRNFRVGGNLTFDFFPDVEGQPGIGLALQSIYYRYRGVGGVLELTGIPYIHKAFRTGSSEVEPYFAFPTGVTLDSGDVRGVVWAAVGSYFQPDPESRIRYGMELGIDVSNAATYVSGGLMYFY